MFEISTDLIYFTCDTDSSNSESLDCDASPSHAWANRAKGGGCEFRYLHVGQHFARLSRRFHKELVLVLSRVRI